MGREWGGVTPPPPPEEDRRLRSRPSGWTLIPVLSTFGRSIPLGSGKGGGVRGSRVRPPNPSVTNPTEGGRAMTEYSNQATQVRLTAPPPGVLCGGNVSGGGGVEGDCLLGM